MKRTILQIIV